MTLRFYRSPCRGLDAYSQVVNLTISSKASLVIVLFFSMLHKRLHLIVSNIFFCVRVSALSLKPKNIQVQSYLGTHCAHLLPETTEAGAAIKHLQLRPVSSLHFYHDLSSF